MRILLVDNHDSFTWNLAQLIGEITGELPRVVPNDALSVDDLLAWRPDRVVLSPGPGTPERAADVGVCRALIERCEAPLLGVCLGHQAIAHAGGARIVRAPEPVHGRVAAIRHDGSGMLFRGLPEELAAVRYHSLVVDAASLPPELRAVAWAGDLVMAIEDRARRRYGVQFHPESIESEQGRALIANFLEESRTGNRVGTGTGTGTGAQEAGHDDGYGYGYDHAGTGTGTGSGTGAGVGTGLGAWCEVAREVGWREPEDVFVALFGGARRAFWLDGAGRGRWSAMGAGDELVTLDRGGSPFAELSRRLAERRVSPSLPFELSTGLCGWLGYELDPVLGSEKRGPLADGALLVADRTVVFDLAARRAFLVAHGRPGDPACARWIESTARRLERVGPAPPVARGQRGGRLRFTLDLPRPRYREAVSRLLEEIRAGETYEACLTTQARCAVDLDPLALHRILRAENPAPYSSFLRVDGAAVVSASPERFLHLSADGAAETRPIKGTRPRGATAADDQALAHALAASAKDRAENLMIVDLARNDLGRVCALGSIDARDRFTVERHPTVHQLVSTVRGRLRDRLGPVDCLRALYPGGSMTGAPKERTRAILDRIEPAARGVYSGALGFFGFAGAVDLAIAIRTLVQVPGELSFGAGGAVVAASDPEGELEEMLLKGRALAAAAASLAGADGWTIE